MGSVRAIALLFAVLLVGTIAGTQLRSTRDLSGTALASPSPVVSLPVDDAGVLADAAAYAQTYGVSQVEAARGLRLQDEIGALNAALERTEAATFAGLWIEHTPRYRVVARFTRDWERTLSRHVSGTPLATMAEARPANYTLAMLETDIEVVAAALSGGPFTASVNVRENRIDIEADTREELESHLRARETRLPASAHIVVMGPSGALDCGDDAGDRYGLFFPRHCTRPWQPVPAAAMEAPLVFRDGCLWLAPSHGQEIYLAVWPPGWVPLMVGGRIEIRDPENVARGTVGELIGVGGGEIAEPAHIAQTIGQEPPAMCRGHRAWFVSGPFRP